MSILYNYFSVQRERINVLLSEKLPSIQSKPDRLSHAMHYVVLNGGKRIRPLLVYLTGEIFHTPAQHLDHVACAVEFIHTYSLVHDDLPAMDNDDLRRGKPTCHKAYDEATAILVGDALQALAFELLSQPHPTIDPTKSLQMIQVLAKAIGPSGMVGGQALDFYSEGESLTLAQIENLDQLKTGALIEACVELAILVSHNVNVEAAQQLRNYAHCLGLGFQIRDDILDIEADKESLGKYPGGDIEKQKATYPSILGLNEAKIKLKYLYTKAQQYLSFFDKNANGLRNLLDELFLD